MEMSVKTTEKLSFLVEEHKQDSRQRWQRTKGEVDEQKRLLKIQLEKRVQVLAENLKKPDFIRTRDKITFTVGVAITCFSPLIGILYPNIRVRNIQSTFFSF